MGKPTSSLVSNDEFIVVRSERGEVKHLSTLRKRNHRDSPSSGERTGNSLNLVYVIGASRCVRGVVRLSGVPRRIP
jgi:hypothetical protein